MAGAGASCECDQEQRDQGALIRSLPGATVVPTVQLGPTKRSRIATHLTGHAPGDAVARGRPPSTRPASSVDALHTDGRLSRQRGPDHRPWRRLLRLRRARKALPRRSLCALLRQHRPWQRRARRGRGRAGAGARVLHQLELRHPASIRLAARIAELARWDSTGCSSPRVDPRRSSRPGSSPGPTTRPAAGRRGRADRPRAGLPRDVDGALAATGLTRCASHLSR